MLALFFLGLPALRRLRLFRRRLHASGLPRLALRSNRALRLPRGAHKVIGLTTGLTRLSRCMGGTINLTRLTRLSPLPQLSLLAGLSRRARARILLVELPRLSRPAACATRRYRSAPGANDA